MSEEEIKLPGAASDDEGEEEEESAPEEEVEDSGSEDEEGEIDFDAVAEKAIEASELSLRKKYKEREISLDVGLTAADLYLRPGLQRTAQPFETGIIAGTSKIDLNDFVDGLGASAPKYSKNSRREVRGATLRANDDRKQRRADAKNEKAERLDKWFGMKKREMTPEIEKELRAIKLRGNFDPKRFYKGQDSKELPKFFTFATEVGGGLAAAGLKPNEGEVRGRSGKSLISQMLKDEKGLEFTRKKAAEVQQRGQASRFSGHGAPRKREQTGTGRKRVGWKKAKKS